MRLGVTHPGLARFFASLRQIVYGVAVEHHSRQTDRSMLSSKLPGRSPDETIFSVSSGQGRAGVAVIRISGPQADAALLALAGRLPPLRIATLMTLHAPGGLRPP
jgi:hypothetical protein